MGASKATDDALTRVKYVRGAIDNVENPDPKLIAQVNAVDKELHDIDDAINGDPVLRSHQEPVPAALVDRIGNAVNGFTTTSAPTQTHQQSLATAEQLYAPLRDRLRKAMDDLENIDKQLNALGAPWTPGRIPD